MKYYYDIIQNMQEWDNIRLGKFTASIAHTVLLGKGKGYSDLIMKIAYERYAGQKADGFKGNSSTDRGHRLEPEARKEFEFLTNIQTELVGFVELDDSVGCSPDFLVADYAVGEIKCYEYKHHLKVLLDKSIDKPVYEQIQFQLYVTGRDRAYYFGYHPNLPEHYEEIHRDGKLIEEIEDKLKTAEKDVEDYITKIKGLK